MKKIGILTINDNYNLGNRLQNFATQEFLKDFGFEVETIQNIKKYYNSNYTFRAKEKIKIIVKYILPKQKYKRYINFLKFNKNINWSEYLIDYNHIPKEINTKYNYFVTGSDQVWNPNFGRMSDIDFLTFADKSKRISLAASFGINEIPKDLKEYYKNRLMDFRSLSVREERAKEIIEELTGRKDQIVILDPTMLIPVEKWNNVIKKPKRMKKIEGKKYILNYFLGNLSDKRKKEIERIAKENDCEVINILDKNDSFYVCGPSEFLYLEKNAFLICTDSFHSAVFAILFNRPFIVFDREDSEVKMNSRLETLLNKFGLNNQWFDKKIKNEQLECDYSQVPQILKEERLKAKKFIDEALN